MDIIYDDLTVENLHVNKLVIHMLCLFFLRLIDMRRTAIGSENASPLFTSSFGGDSHSPLNINGPSPSLPSRPYSGLSLSGYPVNGSGQKPLPPRPSSTNNSSPLLKPQQQSSPLPMLPLFRNSNPRRDYNMPAFPNNYSPQRSVPNLPQLLQLGQSRQLTPVTRASPHNNDPTGGNNSSHVNNPPAKRLFLSPQPTSSYANGFSNSRNSSFVSTRHHGSNSNLLDNGGSNVPYYAELTQSTKGFFPAHSNSESNSFNGGSSIATPTKNENINSVHHTYMMPTVSCPQKPRMRVEWKSVDNLQQQHYAPMLTSTKSIDFGDESGMNSHGGSKTLSFDSLVSTEQNSNGDHTPVKSLENLTSTSTLLLDNGYVPCTKKGMETPPKENEYASPKISPEYDRIKSPAQIALENKERLACMIGISSKKSENSGLDVMMLLKGKMESVAKGKESSGMTNGLLCPVTEVKSETLGSKGSTKSGADSTDCSSLGRSSTSDGDFGTLSLAPSNGSNPTVAMFSSNGGKMFVYNGASLTKDWNTMEQSSLFSGV